MAVSVERAAADGHHVPRAALQVVAANRQKHRRAEPETSTAMLKKKVKLICSLRRTCRGGVGKNTSIFCMFLFVRI